MQRLFVRFRQYAVAAQNISSREKARSALGALIGIGVTALITRLLIGDTSGLPFIVAPLGASALILFALPASPLAQPWPVFGGNTISALIGIACGQYFADPLVAGMVAVGVAVITMFWLRCLHPPGGAAALLAALGGPAVAGAGFWFALTPVALNSLILVAVAIGYNRLCGRQYPHIAGDQGDKHVAPHRPHPAVGVTPEDLDAVLRQHNDLLDISRGDLEDILQKAEMRAYHRQVGAISCADIMSRQLVTVEFGTEIHQAWALLRDHELQALPVVNRFNRLVGLVNQHDILAAADKELHGGFWDKVRGALQRTPGLESNKAEVVGQIMVANPPVAFDDQPIAELIPMMCDAGVHQVPILDRNQRLVGLVAQADMVAALYQAAFERDGVPERKAG
ncbi:HPP family protein [Lacisediminimonas profundi]|uniref:HPP family protein n=1 Tax=Lacisediminimonas profundi TaxID=2603856 RepID=UPI00124B5502|nr:HPP family protein [Lacisediminimonas profundi]